jgi:23S rRNA G2445 N2-methylase RlmL
MLAKNIAPGLKRSFAFEEWPWVETQLVFALRKRSASFYQIRLGVRYNWFGYRCPYG